MGRCAEESKGGSGPVAHMGDSAGRAWTCCMGGGTFPECTTFSVSGKEPQEEGTGGPDAPAM